MHKYLIFTLKFLTCTTIQNYQNLAEQNDKGFLSSNNSDSNDNFGISNASLVCSDESSSGDGYYTPLNLSNRKRKRSYKRELLLKLNKSYVNSPSLDKTNDAFKEEFYGDFKRKGTEHKTQREKGKNTDLGLFTSQSEIFDIYINLEKINTANKFSTKDSAKFDYLSFKPEIFNSTKNNSIDIISNDKDIDITTVLSQEEIKPGETTKVTTLDIQKLTLNNILQNPKIKEKYLNTSSELDHNQGHSALSELKKLCSNLSSFSNNLSYTNNLINKSGHYKETDCSFVKKFDIFLSLVEDSFNKYIYDILKRKEITIYQILYVHEFLIVDKFQVDIFGLFDIDSLNVAKKISSSYDVLNSFIKNFKKSEIIIESLINCIDPSIRSNNIEELAKKIKTLIINYLKSTESEHIKCFLPQLRSYVNMASKIEIYYNENVIDGLIVFLFLLKRNSLCKQHLEINISRSCDIIAIKNIFLNETLHNSVFLAVFLNYWPIIMKYNILLNISTIITLNCVLVYNILPKKHGDHINIILISEHLLFELMQKEIFIDINSFLLDDLEGKKLFKKHKQFKTLLYEIKELVFKYKLIICDEFREKLSSFNLGKKMESNLKAALCKPEHLALCHIRAMLDFLNRYFGLGNRLKRDYINFHLKNIFGKTKKKIMNL